jgi:hypothetical protein
VRGESLITAPALVRSGASVLWLHNQTSDVASLRIEVPRKDTDYTSAAHAILHPSFQAIASRERVHEGDYLAVSDQAYLCVELPEIAQLHKDEDPAVFERIDELERGFREIAAKYSGSVFHRAYTLGLMIAGFSSIHAALAAALACFDQLSKGLRASIHSGPALAHSRDGSIEYFGRTIQQSITILRMLQPGTLGVAPALLAKHELLTSLSTAKQTMHVIAGDAVLARIGVISPALATSS